MLMSNRHRAPPAFWELCSKSVYEKDGLSWHQKHWRWQKWLTEGCGKHSHRLDSLTYETSDAISFLGFVDNPWGNCKEAWAKSGLCIRSLVWFKQSRNWRAHSLSVSREKCVQAHSQVSTTPTNCLCTTYYKVHTTCGADYNSGFRVWCGGTYFFWPSLWFWLG